MIIDTLFGTPIDDLVYRPSKTSTRNIIEELKREYIFSVDLNKFETTPTDTKAVFIKGDRNTSILKVTISKSNTPVNLTGYTVSANIKEVSNETVTMPCTIIDATTGLIEINLPQNYVDEEGESVFELSLQKDDKVIVTQQYKYTVLGSLGEGRAGEESQLTLLQSLIQQVQESKTTVDTIVNELEVTQTDIDEILGMVGGL